MNKLNEMRDKLAKKLADPELYEDSRAGRAGDLEQEIRRSDGCPGPRRSALDGALEKLDQAETV